MLRHPPAAIVAAGGTGELYSLSPAEHLAVVRAAVEEAAGKVPVIAGVGFNGPIGAGLAQQAADAGASGILAFPPYYPGGEDEGLLQYYQSIGSATGLGLIIYSRDWFHPSALARRTADEHSQPRRLEGWSGRYPAAADPAGARRRPPALDRRRRRRSRAGLLRHRHPRVHVERRQRRPRRSRGSFTTPPRAATRPRCRR